ncbi:MAG: RdgB/HAM1 family non-canonical purine NTP pyrophosphatase [Beijerinckiaceae bacterium]|jgi:XTP/dITP diphosphohydrolase
MARLIQGRIIVASHNEGKLAEMRELLEPYGIEAVSAGALGLVEPDETGTTFIANAKIKAEAATAATGLPAFADDSGLCVDALGGQPGILSARWAKEAGSFTLAMDGIERRLAAINAEPPYGARFVSALALSRLGHETLTFVGTIEGTLTFPPRGKLGFGYDPIFLPEGMTRSFGEISSIEKHGIPADGSRALSHRARAFQDFARACLRD